MVLLSDSSIVRLAAIQSYNASQKLTVLHDGGCGWGASCDAWTPVSHPVKCDPLACSVEVSCRLRGPSNLRNAADGGVTHPETNLRSESRCGRKSPFPSRLSSVVSVAPCGHDPSTEDLILDLPLTPPAHHQGSARTVSPAAQNATLVRSRYCDGAYRGSRIGWCLNQNSAWTFR